MPLRGVYRNLKRCLVFAVPSCFRGNRYQEQISDARCQMPDNGCQLSAVSYQLSASGQQASEECRLAANVVSGLEASEANGLISGSEALSDRRELRRAIWFCAF